jgi:hypothetical protein
MSDLVFVAIIVTFFALAALFVKACDRIIGPEEHTAAESPTSDPEQDRVAA